MKFYVAEVQNVNSVREAEEISAKDLTEAKERQAAVRLSAERYLLSGLR